MLGNLGSTRSFAKLVCSGGRFGNSGIDDLIGCYAIKLIVIGCVVMCCDWKLAIGSAWLSDGNVVQYLFECKNNRCCDC